MKIYNKPGSKERLLEMMKEVNKVKINEDLNSILHYSQGARDSGNLFNSKNVTTTYQYVLKNVFDEAGIDLVDIIDDKEDMNKYYLIVNHNGKNYKFFINGNRLNNARKVGNAVMKKLGISNLKEEQGMIQKDNVLDMAFQKLKSGALEMEQGGSFSSTSQSVDNKTYVGINGFDSNKNMYNFNFLVTGSETDQEGVLNIDQLVLEKFYYQNSDKTQMIEFDEDGLRDFNSKHDVDELYSVIEKYIDVEESEDLTEFFNMEFNKREDSQPFGGSKENYQDGVGYGDEKPVNPKLRVKAPELEKFVKEENPPQGWEDNEFDEDGAAEFNDYHNKYDLPVGDNTVVIKINDYPWYLRKAGDSTHFYMSNDAQALNTGAAWVSHIGEHRNKPYYNDIRAWLKGGESPTGKEYDDPMTMDERSGPERSEGLEGEDLLKSKYKHLNSDMEFKKMANAYENLIDLQKNKFRAKYVSQEALSALRDMITTYLNVEKNLPVKREDVQNFFINWLGKYSTTISEEKVKFEDADLDPKDEDNDGDFMPGGLGDDANIEDFDSQQILKGMEVELEHTNDPKVALEIAMDHLVELPDYYNRLEKMEKQGEEDLGSDIEIPEKNVDDVENIDEFSDYFNDLKSADEELKNQLTGYDIKTPNTVGEF